jgi:hypothetical protein
LWPACPPLVWPDGSRRLVGFFRKPSLEGGFELVDLSSQACASNRHSPSARPDSALKLDHPRLERLDPALKPFDDAANLGAKLHSRRESQSSPARSPQITPPAAFPVTVTLRTHLLLGSYFF